MSLPLTISLDTKESQELQNVVQQELARRRWSEGEDDAVMSEYILVMLANRKTAEQVASELKELIGDAEGDGGGSSSSGVDEFVAWLWSRGLQVVAGGQRQERDRRSASPTSRKDAEDRYARPNEGGERSTGRWGAEESKESGRKELFDDHELGHDRALRMDRNTRQQPVRDTRSASGGRAFGRGMEQAHRSTTGTAPSSIFARTGVPNPHAGEFVPRGATGTPIGSTSQSLLHRLDPMIPDNSRSTAGGEQTSSAPMEYPTKPLEASLCRWALKCTAPTCLYSHPSPSAVSRQKQTGEEPLVLRSEPCHYQSTCSKPDCEFSHISPAIGFVIAKANRATAVAFGHGATADPSSNAGVKEKSDGPLKTVSAPCRYGAACYRQDCHFQHPPERAAHISDRLKSFSSVGDETEMETIIPVA